MSEETNQKVDELAGVFVETALTNEQVAQAIVEEERLGLRDSTCEFLISSGRNGTVAAEIKVDK